MKEIENKI